MASLTSIQQPTHTHNTFIQINMYTTKQCLSKWIMGNAKLKIPNSIPKDRCHCCRRQHCHQQRWYLCEFACVGVRMYLFIRCICNKVDLLLSVQYNTPENGLSLTQRIWSDMIKCQHPFSYSYLWNKGRTSFCHMAHNKRYKRKNTNGRSMFDLNETLCTLMYWNTCDLCDLIFIRLSSEQQEPIQKKATMWNHTLSNLEIQIIYSKFVRILTFCMIILWMENMTNCKWITFNCHYYFIAHRCTKMYSHLKSWNFLTHSKCVYCIVYHFHSWIQFHKSTEIVAER